MASEWASSILQRVAPIDYDLSDDELMEAIDAELQEVRDCFTALARRTVGGAPCWCEKRVKSDQWNTPRHSDDHDEACLRTRTLYTSVSVRGVDRP